MDGEFNVSCEVVRLYGGRTEMGYFKSEKVLYPEMFNKKPCKPELNRKCFGLKSNVSPKFVLIQHSY